jgi:hypothetical protein
MMFSQSQLTPVFSLQAFAGRCLEVLRLPTEDAQLVARCLVEEWLGAGWVLPR